MANPSYPDPDWSTEAPSPSWMPWKVLDADDTPIATCGTKEMAIAIERLPAIDRAAYELVTWWDGLTSTQRDQMIAIDDGIWHRVDYARTVKIRGGTEA